MPDMKSELSKVINTWEPTPEPIKEEPKVYFTTTNNVCRATFECIKYNPGSTRKEVVDSLTSKGFKASSTTTLIGQMIKQSHVRESNGLLYAVNTEYEPLKGSKAWAKLQGAAQQRKKITIVNTRTGEVLNPRPAPAPVVVPIPVVKEWSPNDVIDKLTVHQAIALFKALRSVLVG